MKKLFELVKQYFTRNRFNELDKKIDALEKRIFNKKDSNKLSWSDFLYTPSFFSFEPEPLEKEIDILKEKLDAVCKYLKVSLEHKSSEEKYVVKKKVTIP